MNRDQFERLMEAMDREFQLTPEAVAQAVTLASMTPEERISLRYSVALDAPQAAKLLGDVWSLAYLLDPGQYYFVKGENEGVIGREAGSERGSFAF